MHSTNSISRGKTPQTPLREQGFPISGPFSIVGFSELYGRECVRWKYVLYRVELLVHTAHAGSVPRSVFIKGASDLVTFRRFSRVALGRGAILDHPTLRTGKEGREGRVQWEREVACMVNGHAAGKVANHG